MKASVLLLAWALIALPGSRAWSDPRDFGQIDRGRYLATVGDCLARHTAADGKPFAGGRAIATPFGTLVSPNITPDRETGIGAWTDDEFVRATRRGVGRGGVLCTKRLGQQGLRGFGWQGRRGAARGDVGVNRAVQGGNLVLYCNRIGAA